MLVDVVFYFGAYLDSILDDRQRPGFVSKDVLVVPLIYYCPMNHFFN